MIVLKALITALVVIFLSELGKKHPVLSGLIAAMPITTLFVVFWLYFDTHDITIIKTFSFSVLFGLIPTAFFFLSLFFLLGKSFPFFKALLCSFAVWLIAAVIHIGILSKG